jgi:carbamoyl-phosphate synthase small subunit
VLADGTAIFGAGVGATGVAVGEVCFNTAMTGYQEILTDPSYAGQIVTFTFPHIGNVGVNSEDLETTWRGAAERVRGCVLRASVTEPSNYRATGHLGDWLAANGIVGITGIDTRALTNRIREQGMMNAAIAHDADGRFDLAALRAQAAAAPAMEGAELASKVSRPDVLTWREGVWRWGVGASAAAEPPRYRVVAFDYGIKTNILRLFADRGVEVMVLPATAAIEDVMALQPDGLFLSNGPGDPAATGYAVPALKAALDRELPTFGICLGHQLLGLAIGARTKKMHQGHHGANHPVMDFTTGKVEIVSMNHGFAVDVETLPATAAETHRSLFDGSNAGLKLTDRPAFSVQYHPEASPGPQDSHYLFDRFLNLVRERRGEPPLPEGVEPHPATAA